MHQLLENYPLWVSIIAIALAQFFKVLWNYTYHRVWDWNWLIKTGSMPSGHTAAVTSLATAIGLQEGWNSPAFAIATILAIIVMYDAIGVRRHAGMQARVLNRLMEDFTQLLMEIRKDKINPSQAGIKLKEILGHQPIEVFTGVWLGIFIAFITYWVWPL